MPCIYEVDILLGRGFCNKESRWSHVCVRDLLGRFGEGRIGEGLGFRMDLGTCLWDGFRKGLGGIWEGFMEEF